MSKAFQKFADSTIGSWIIMGLAVVAFLLVLKMSASQFLKQDGWQGAIRAAIAAI